MTLSSCVLAKMHQIPLMLLFASPLACVCVCSSLKPAVCVYSTWFIPAPGEQAAGSWPVTSHPLRQTHTIAARTWAHMEPGHFESTDMRLPARCACTRRHLFHLFQLRLTSCACWLYLRASPGLPAPGEQGCRQQSSHMASTLRKLTRDEQKLPLSLSHRFILPTTLPRKIESPAQQVQVLCFMLQNKTPCCFVYCTGWWTCAVALK